MRTKNAKRLWPVPVTLGVMALAALLAFGLMATNGAQPAAAQDDDDPDCAVKIGTNSVPQPLADAELNCSVHVSPAVIAVPGDARAVDGTDDADVTAWVYAQDGTIEGGTGLTDVWDHDATAGNVDDYDDAREAGNSIARVATPKATKFSAIKLDIDPASEGLSGGGLKRTLENITVTPASGKSKVTLYIYYSNSPRIIPAANFDHDGAAANDLVKQITAPGADDADASGTMVITFLGAPSLTRADTEKCVDNTSPTPVAVECDSADVVDANMDGIIDDDENADASSALYVAGVATQTDPISETIPDGLNQPFAFGSKGPYDINEAASDTQVFVVAQIKDGNGVALSDTGDSKAKSRVTFTISYADGSDLETNPITPAVEPVDMNGKAMTLLNHWKSGNKPMRATVTAMYSGPTGDLDLGSVVVFRDGPAMTADFGTYSCAEDEDVTKAAMGCEAGYMATADMRFARGESAIVNGTFADALGSTVLNDSGDPIDPIIMIADGDKDHLTVTTEAADAVDEVDMFTTGAMLVEIDSEAEYREYTITITNGETGDDEVTQDLMFTVAGPPKTYEFSDPAMYIPATLGSSQMFTLVAMDENGNVPDFTDLKDVQIVVLGVESSYVTGRGANNKANFDEETGEASFTIYAPVGAEQGDTVLIQVRVDDEVVATHTAMFGEEPMMPGMPGMPMNVMAEATSDTMITVSWDAVMDATSYMVERGYMDADNMKMWMTVAEMTMDTMYMDSGLMAETTYYYRVTAMNDAGSGDASDGMAMAMTMAEDMPTDGEMLTSPSGVDAASLPGTGAVSVSWTPGQNATQHWVVLFSLPGYDVGGRVEVLNDPDANFQVFKNVPNGEYEVVVASYDPDTGFQYQDGIGMVTVE